MLIVTDARQRHGYHALPIAEIVQETPDTRTFVFDVPAELADTYRYLPGQFCTVRAHVDGDLDGDPVLRCYSMSSAPATDTRLAVTVKRVAGGAMSNWLHDRVAVGDTLELMPPSGTFVAKPNTTPLVALCGGSGVTPVYSLVKEALASGPRRVRVLYANRDADSVIFRAGFDQLAAAHPDRIDVRHHLDTDAGYLTADAIAEFVGADTGADFYICGPTPFMDLAEAALAAAGVPAEQISIERFGDVPVEARLADTAPAGPDDDAAGPASLTIVLRGKTTTTDYTPGDTVLDAARRAGLKPPYSCELGNCASCMALVKEGHVRMRQNNALTPEEVAEGWVLTCQGLPDTSVTVVEYEDL